MRRPRLTEKTADALHYSALRLLSEVESIESDEEPQHEVCEDMRRAINYMLDLSRWYFTKHR